AAPPPTDTGRPVPPGGTLEAKAAAGAVNSDRPGRRTTGPTHRHLRRHYGWTIELQFRAFKQTFGRGTLRSRSAGCAAVELEWSLVGLWMIQLFAVKEQIELEIAPGRSSVALALGVIRDLMRDRTEPASGRALRERLRRAVHH